MATRQVLADLVQAWQAQGGEPVDIESVGGVDAAQRVRNGKLLMWCSWLRTPSRI